MRKLNFGVVTLALSFLIGFSVLLKALRPMLPPQKPNNLVVEKGDYMAQGVNQAVNWRPLDPAAFAEARRRTRPVLLSLGAVWSTDAKRADTYFFSDPEVQSYLGRHFVCVRADLDREPFLGQVFAPISRVDNPQVANPFTVGSQVVFLMPDGTPFRFLGTGMLPGDPTAFLRQLANAFDDYVERTRATGTRSVQAEDRRLLLTGEAGSASISEYTKRLLAWVDLRKGGFANTAPTARMMAWKSLLVTGNYDAYDAAIRPFVKSGLVDWLDGGFFQRAADLGLRRVQFGKPSIYNAEVMHVLALGGILENDKFQTRLAKNAFEWLAEKAVKDGFVATARLTLANDFGRDARSSFYAKEFREFWGTGSLSGEEALWARENLGLRVEENEPMVIKISRPETLDDPKFLPIITKLRKSKENIQLKLTAVPRADVNGIAVARMTACARLWNEPDHLEQCRNLFLKLDEFLADTDVGHMVPFDMSLDRYLGDYLAYADAALEMYQATGDVGILEKGRRVLVRADKIFRTSHPGIWTPMPTPYTGAIKDIDVPEMVDNLGESLTAKMMRLANSYFRLAPGKELEDMNDWAFGSINNLSGLLPATGLLGGGLYCSAAGMIDDVYAVATGPSAVALANELKRLRPVRLVAPLAKGLPNADRAPGIYVVSGETWQGPMTVSEAAAALPTSLDPG